MMTYFLMYLSIRITRSILDQKESLYKHNSVLHSTLLDLTLDVDKEREIKRVRLTGNLAEKSNLNLRIDRA